MHYIGIANYKTYKNAFDDLVEFGFIEVVGRSTNNYTATVSNLSEGIYFVTGVNENEIVKQKVVVIK